MFHLPISAVMEACQARMGVVPVIAQAGTALFPLILLAVTSAVGLLLKPRALLHVLRRRPWIPMLLLALGCGAWWVVAQSTAAPPLTGGGQRSQGAAATLGGPRSDWARVALAIIEQDAAARIRAAQVGAVVAPPGAAPAASVARTPGEAARYFRGDERRSGFLGGVAPRGLIPAWSFVAADDDLSMYLSSPLVAGGAVYAASCYLDPPTSSGTVVCIDALMGRLRWSCSVKRPSPTAGFKGFISSPALSADGRSLVIGQGLHSDYDSELVCLD
ncbi:MAG: PQQ-like beta-propeller repeat protein, partial [Planctomycetes bacterium]|nr:PQQ-like beta-propeller repeat protein [Planctomycetota bacterium]